MKWRRPATTGGGHPEQIDRIPEPTAGPSTPSGASSANAPGTSRRTRRGKKVAAVPPPLRRGTYIEPEVELPPGFDPPSAALAPPSGEPRR